MPARAFTTYRSAGPVLPEFLSNLKNLFKVAYIYPYDVSAARTQNSKDFFYCKSYPTVYHIYFLQNSLDLGFFRPLSILLLYLLYCSPTLKFQKFLSTP